MKLCQDRGRGIFFGLALGCVACATNPATGERELSLIGEQQEISMGRQADRDVQATIGVYDDPTLEAYIEGVGNRLAAASERPNLPWTFRVADDPAVNALLMQNHGLITVGHNLKEAYYRTEVIEDAARIYWIASTVGTPRTLSGEEATEILNLEAERYRQRLLRDAEPS